MFCQNNHPSYQNSQKKKHKLNIFHLLLHTAVVWIGWLGFFEWIFFFTVFVQHFNPVPFITALKMIDKLKGITLPIAEIHCDKRQQMLNNTNQQLRMGQKKKKEEPKFIYKSIPGHGIFVYLHQRSLRIQWTCYPASKQYCINQKCKVCPCALNFSSPRE